MSAQPSPVGLDQVERLANDLVRVSKIALSERSVEATPLLRRLARDYRTTQPDLAASLVSLLRDSPVRAATPLTSAQPVDNESRLPLVRQETDGSRHIKPILAPPLAAALLQLAEEHQEPSRLFAAGLAPTRTALFVGPPGVGKTLAARWLASALDLRLLTLDLSAVMSSFLGKTGTNVRRVLDHAKSTPCVLLLDEVDAVAKRRDDTTEVGELKRLVTVLLQEIDGWPEGSLLLAATNHPDLLDPAIWRRFESVLEFPLPGPAELKEALILYSGEHGLGGPLTELLSQVFQGYSFSDVERELMRARRVSAVQDSNLEDALLIAVRDRFSSMPTKDKVNLAVELVRNTNLSQRRLHEITGVSRDTMRKHLSLVSAGSDVSNG